MQYSDKFVLCCNVAQCTPTLHVLVRGVDTIPYKPWHSTSSSHSHSFSPRTHGFRSTTIPVNNNNLPVATFQYTIISLSSQSPAMADAPLCPYGRFCPQGSSLKPPTRGVSRAAPTPTPRRGKYRGKMESEEPRRQRRVCPRNKKASSGSRIDVRRCARVTANIDGHSLQRSNRSLRGSSQTGGFTMRACLCL
jgi:hypothetical protein